MGPFLLPLEKIPLNVWLLLVVLIFGCLATVEEFWSVRQIIDIAVVVFAITIFIWRIFKRRGNSDADE